MTQTTILTLVFCFLALPAFACKVGDKVESNDAYIVSCHYSKASDYAVDSKGRVIPDDTKAVIAAYTASVPVCSRDQLFHSCQVEMNYFCYEVDTLRNFNCQNLEKCNYEGKHINPVCREK